MNFIIMLSLLVASLQASVPSTLGLKEAFESAKRNMETLQRSNAQLKQAIERKNQARATLLPTLSAVGNETRIDPPNVRPGVSRAFILTRQYSAGLRLQMPLIRGGAFSALQTRREEILLSEFQKNANELTLYQLVVSAYYGVVLAKLDLENLKELLKFSQERQKELETLTEVGRSRKTELVQAQTQALAAETQYRQGEMVLQESMENFEFYTGIKAEQLEAFGHLPKELPRLSEFLDKLKQRPDLKARLQEVVIADKKLEVSKGGHYPNVDLVSNYYFDRTGILQTSEWDVAVVVNFPLFQGGLVNAQIRESTESKRIAQLSSDETIRTARRDMVVLYQNYLQMQEQLETMNKALKKAEEAYRLNLKDYRYGQVSNLEVLQSLNLFVETKRSYHNLLAQTHLTYKNLEASTGVLP
jgi:outer membrane protein